MKPDPKERLRHMLDACRAAGRISAGRKRSDLDEDEMLLFALVRLVEIIGEAAMESLVRSCEAPQGRVWRPRR